MGRVTKTTNAQNAQASMTYDAAGNIATSTNYAGVMTSYAYDGLDRLTSKTTGTAVVSFTYTVDGLPDTVTDASGTTTYTYDTMNGLTDIQYPDGTTIHYVYDTAFRLKSVQTAYGTTNYDYDQMNRLTSVTDLTGAVTNYTYDANGNRESMAYANGVTTNYAYDTCNRLTAETVTDSAGSVIESYAITLGAAGERTQIVELHRTVTYEYDTLYRLTKETISADGLSKETAYTYAAMGNRLTKTSDGVVTNYTYNTLNQLISENDIAYTYDANGSQVSQQSPAKTAAYTYDQEGRLNSAVVTAGGTTTTEEYRYNWTGIRTAKITDGVETRYLIDPNSSLSQVIAELDSAGNVLTFYTRGAELISLHRTGETRYYQYDANGSVRLLTDGTGAVTDTYTYDAFGNLLAKTGTTVNNYLYSGEQFDANTGFYYLRARYMNPSTGTFISMDPAQGSIFDPVSLHKYLYANANPVMNCDPSGRSTLQEMGAAMLLQGAISGCMSTMISIANYLFQGGKIGDENCGKVALTAFLTGAVLGALFGGMGMMAAESVQASMLLRWTFVGLGSLSFANAINLIMQGDYVGGALGIVTTILCFFGAKQNYYRDLGSIKFTITAEDVAIGGSESWYKPDGSINYPPQGGKIPGSEVDVELQPGKTLGRYGDIGPTSNYVTESGAPPGKLSLPPNTDPSIYHEITVLKPIPGVIQSTVTPWAGSPGFGLQYELPKPILWYYKNGYITY